MLVTLKAIYVNDKSRDGKPLIAKNGNPYWSVVLDTQEHGKLYNNIFNEDFIPKWQKGQQVPVEISQKGSSKYWNFVKSSDGNPYKAYPDDHGHYESDKVHAGAAGYIQKHNPMEAPPTYQQAQQVFETKKPLDPDAEGKVRHGVSIAFIERGIPLSEDTKLQISQWTDFIMNGK